MQWLSVVLSIHEKVFKLRDGSRIGIGKTARLGWSSKWCFNIVYMYWWLTRTKHSSLFRRYVSDSKECFNIGYRRLPESTRARSTFRRRTCFNRRTRRTRRPTTARRPSTRAWTTWRRRRRRRQSPPKRQQRGG